jgi:hypothetical protein
MTRLGEHGDPKVTARIAGACYLALAITGAAGFIVVRPMLYVPGDAALTARNLAQKVALDQVCVTLELGIALTQALTAIAFYKLFRKLDAVAAVAIAGFGIVNATLILISAACITTAVAVAGNVSLAPAGDMVATSQLLFEMSSRVWGVGALFFGLWLVPMGCVPITTGIMPKALGWTLIVGGVGYVISGFVSSAFRSAPRWLVDGLTVPASVGELWTIAYLLAVGVKPVQTRE